MPTWGFSTTGSWGTGTGGYAGNYRTHGVGDGSATSSWTFTALAPGTWYQVATTWQVNYDYWSEFADDVPFAILDGDRWLAQPRVNQNYRPNDFQDAGVGWRTLGYFLVNTDTLTVQLSDRIRNLAAQADAVRVQRVAGDGAADDDFRLQPGSPGVDRGEPHDYYFREPAPNGERIDVRRVRQHAASHRQSRAVGPEGGTTWSTTTTVDTSGVDNPAPPSVYQSQRGAESGVGKQLRYQLDVPDGDYTIRLHFAENEITTAGLRVFDVQLQGLTVRSNYEVLADAGGRHRAVALSFAVTAAGGHGISLELVNRTIWNAILSGIELSATNPAGVPVPTATLQVSTDNGGTWAGTAAGLALDRFGRGSTVWTAGPQTAGYQGRLRLIADQAPTVRDDSDEPFLVTNGGNHFYVNDDSQTGDLLTTAVGNNAHTGKIPNQPLATLAALLDAYDLEPGDVVHVDTGHYDLLRTLVIGHQDSGVRIAGPPSAAAVLDRENWSELHGTVTRYTKAIELQNADDVTLDQLQVTGSWYGLYAGADADSDRLTVSNCVIGGHRWQGLQLLASNEFAVIRDSTFYGVPGGSELDDQLYGVGVYGNDAQISGNTIRDHASTGLTVTGLRHVVSGNDVYRNRDGVSASAQATGADRITISGNTVHHNVGTTGSGIGLSLGAGVLATGNVVYGQGDGVSAGAGDLSDPGPGRRWPTTWSTATARHSDDPRHRPREPRVQQLRTRHSRRGRRRHHRQLRLLQFAGHPRRDIARPGRQQLGLREYQRRPAGDVAAMVKWPPECRQQHDLPARRRRCPPGGGLGRFLQQPGLGLGGARCVCHRGQPEQPAQRLQPAAPGRRPRRPRGLLRQRRARHAGRLADRDRPRCPQPGGRSAVCRSRRGRQRAGLPRRCRPGRRRPGRQLLSCQALARHRPRPGLARPRDRYRRARPGRRPGHAQPRLARLHGNERRAGGVHAHAAGRGHGERLAGRRRGLDSDAAVRLPLGWHELHDDISVDTATAGQVTIRWNATNKADGSDVNTAVTLFSDGRYRLDYGPGNRGLTPTIGVSSGDGQTYDLSSYNGLSNLHYAKALMQRPVAAGAYLPVILPDNEFEAVGTAQNWKADNSTWTLALPFAFPFYDGSYTSVQVSSNGFLQFAGPDWAGDRWNSTSSLARNRRIAPLWDDLTTEYDNDDIYVDTSRSGEVTIRWQTDYGDVQTAVTLYADGRIRLHDGAENTYLTPTVGVSAGDNLNYTLVAGYDGEATLCRRHSVELQRVDSPHFAESPAGGFGVFNLRGTAKGWHYSGTATPCPGPSLSTTRRSAACT